MHVDVYRVTVWSQSPSACSSLLLHRGEPPKTQNAMTYTNRVLTSEVLQLEIHFSEHWTDTEGALVREMFSTVFDLGLPLSRQVLPKNQSGSPAGWPSWASPNGRRRPCPLELQRGAGEAPLAARDSAKSECSISMAGGYVNFPLLPQERLHLWAASSFCHNKPPSR